MAFSISVLVRWSTWASTQPPPLREGTELWRPIGRSFDPRTAIIKDTSGPLTVVEVGMEITV